jgi:hypothetical protein
LPLLSKVLTLIVVMIKLALKLMKTTCFVTGYFIKRVSFRDEIISFLI